MYQNTYTDEGRKEMTMNQNHETAHFISGPQETHYSVPLPQTKTSTNLSHDLNKNNSDFHDRICLSASQGYYRSYILESGTRLHIVKFFTSILTH